MFSRGREPVPGAQGQEGRVPEAVAGALPQQDGRQRPVLQPHSGPPRAQGARQREEAVRLAVEVHEPPGDEAGLLPEVLYYTIHYTLLYTIHYILYTIHYTLYTTHYTLYTIHYAIPEVGVLPRADVPEVGGPDLP